MSDGRGRQLRPRSAAGVSLSRSSPTARPGRRRTSARLRVASRWDSDQLFEAVREAVLARGLDDVAVQAGGLPRAVRRRATGGGPGAGPALRACPARRARAYRRAGEQPGW